jgi:hypothetical protein
MDLNNREVYKDLIKQLLNEVSLLLKKGFWNTVKPLPFFKNLRLKNLFLQTQIDKMLS